MGPTDAQDVVKVACGGDGVGDDVFPQITHREVAKFRGVVVPLAVYRCGGETKMPAPPIEFDNDHFVGEKGVDHVRPAASGWQRHLAIGRREPCRKHQLGESAFQFGRWRRLPTGPLIEHGSERAHPSPATWGKLPDNFVQVHQF